MASGMDNGIMNRIIAASGKSESEIEGLIEGKKEKFSGLLTDTGAAFMVAKELGVDIGGAISATKIGSLKEGMNNVDVVARVKAAFSPREFESKGRKGKLVNLILWDGSAEIRATLWNKDADSFTQKGFAKGDCVRFSNCTVSSYNGVLQLGLNYNSEFEKTEAKEIPALERNEKKISELEAGMNEVCVRASVKKIFPARAFENDRGKGKVMNFIIASGSDEIRATAWNEQCDEIEELFEGTEITIEGAYTKEGRDGVELHLGKRARVIKPEGA